MGLSVLSALASAPQSHKNDCPLSNGYKTQTSQIKPHTTCISQFLPFNAVIKQKEKRKNGFVQDCDIAFSHPFRLAGIHGGWRSHEESGPDLLQ